MPCVWRRCNVCLYICRENDIDTILRRQSPMRWCALYLYCKNLHFAKRPFRRRKSFNPLPLFLCGTDSGNCPMLMCCRTGKKSSPRTLLLLISSIKQSFCGYFGVFGTESRDHIITTNLFSIFRGIIKNRISNQSRLKSNSKKE